MPKLTRNEQRKEAATSLAAMDCGIFPVTFDRRSSSYGIGKLDGSGYFTPTFPSEGSLLDWATSNLGRIERFVHSGEPVEPGEFITHVLTAAFVATGEDPSAFAETLAPRLHEMMADTELIGDRDLEWLIDGIEDGTRSPTEIMRDASNIFGFELEVPSPRPA